jgi:hypothetical protein
MNTEISSTENLRQKEKNRIVGTCYLMSQFYLSFTWIELMILLMDFANEKLENNTIIFTVCVAITSFVFYIPVSLFRQSKEHVALMFEEGLIAEWLFLWILMSLLFLGSMLSISKGNYDNVGWAVLFILLIIAGFFCIFKKRTKEWDF